MIPARHRGFAPNTPELLYKAFVSRAKESSLAYSCLWVADQSTPEPMWTQGLSDGDLARHQHRMQTLLTRYRQMSGSELEGCVVTGRVYDSGRYGPAGMMTVDQGIADWLMRVNLPERRTFADIAVVGGEVVRASFSAPRRRRITPMQPFDVQCLVHDLRFGPVIEGSV